MHELSIALSLVEKAEEEAVRQGGGEVCAVHLRLGLLSGVVKEALLFSFELACEGTVAAGAKLVIEDVPVRIDCRRCEGERDVVSLQCLLCSQCGGPGPVTSGRELELAALEWNACAPC